MIIGLTGENCAGKSTIAEYLMKKGFYYYSLSDVIREEVKAEGNNELSKVKRLVHCMHVAGKYMKKRTRRDVWNKICLGLGLG